MIKHTTSPILSPLLPPLTRKPFLAPFIHYMIMGKPQHPILSMKRWDLDILKGTKYDDISILESGSYFYN